MLRATACGDSTFSLGERGLHDAGKRGGQEGGRGWGDEEKEGNEKKSCPEERQFVGKEMTEAQDN